jgi:hypothetical protein
MPRMSKPLRPDSDQVRDLFNRLGRPDAQAALGLPNQSAITDAIAAGVIPARYYLGLDRLGSEKGVEVPQHLFSWRLPQAAE